MNKVTKTKKVAVKYNGNQLDNKRAVCNYDYMVFNYYGKPNFKELPDHVKHEKMEYGTKVFKDVVNISIENERFCSLVYNPRNIKLGVDLVQIKLENHIMYRYSLEETKEVLQALTNTIKLKIRGVSRLDVAIDFENSSDYMRSMIKDILTGEALISGRTKKVSLFNEVANCYGNTKNGLLEYNGLSIGKKSSSRYLRIYNKSLEMEQIKYKHHIANHWKNGGFKDLSNVWRFEYALNSTFIREFKVTFDDVFKEDFVINLLKTAYKNHFELKQNTGKKEINKEKSLYVFNFDIVKSVTKILSKVKKEITETIQRSIISVKRQVKGLYRSHYSTKNDWFYNALFVHLRNYDLVSWFEAKKDDYLTEFQKQSLKLQNQ